MKFCPECGSKLVEGKKFCTECGFRINQTVSIPVESKVNIQPESPQTAVTKSSAKNYIKASLISSVTRRVGLKTYTFIFTMIFLFHAIWITVGVPQYLWVVSLQDAANIAITEYLLSMFITVVLVFRVVTGSHREYLRDGVTVKKRRIREL